MKLMPKVMIIGLVTLGLAGCKNQTATSIAPEDAPESIVAEQQAGSQTGDYAPPPFPSLPSGWHQVNHPEGFFVVGLPEGWQSSTTELVGVEETGFSAESPDFKAFPDGKYDGPLTYVHFVTGAKVDISTHKGVEFAQAEPEGTVFETREMQIAGQKGVFRSFKEPATTQGQFLEARVAVSDTSYRLVMGYNPESFPEGKALFEKIASSFRPSGFIPSESAPLPAASGEAEASPEPTN